MTDDDRTALTAKLRELYDEWGEAMARAAFEQKTAGLSPEQRTQIEALVFFGSGNQFGDVTMGDVAGEDVVKGAVNVDGHARLYGPTIGVNLGTVIYGQAPSTDERRRLIWYLEGLAQHLVVLPLRGLQPRQSGAQRLDLELPRVYVALATTTHTEVARGTGHALRAYFTDDDPQQPLKRDYDPAYALPDAALYRDDVGGRSDEIILRRALMAVAAVQQHAHVVLLGDPGGGKSTFLRYVAWGLAWRELDPQHAPALPGWDERRPRLPILVSLRTLAGCVAHKGCSDTTVYATLREAMLACGTHEVDDALRAALAHGAALLLFDGLDEVPLEGTPDVADRLTTLQAVRAIAQRYAACPVVLTCRTRAFSDDLRGEWGWSVETLAAFTLGQIRQFVPAWYGELVAKHQLTSAQADQVSASLLAALHDPARPRLGAMAASPLLLTLMALVLYHNGELPRDRPQLYERILELLLGQWDQVHAGQSLGQAIGKPEWDSSYLGPLLDTLSYQAHASATSTDGVGRLERGAVYKALIDFFTHAEVRGPWEAAQRCLDYIEQRSGLLSPDGRDSYKFVHLTLQEHCAGRHIALNSADPVNLVLAHRMEDRWREPIFLGAGLMAPLVLDRLLNDLLEREEGNGAKPVARWYRDLILAAEIGADRDWTFLRTRPQVRVERVQRDLRVGLVALLTDVAQPLPLPERINAGTLLGTLSDPRIPVTAAQWQTEWARCTTTFGAPTGYWCYVRQGAYRIGGWAAKEPEATISLSAFWLARYPITVAQYAPFVAEGYREDAEHWWTKEGWQWKQSGTPTMQPWGWNDPQYNGPNQPVIGLTWYEATAYCAWLNAQVPRTDYELRLPTEAEWEVAAAYDAEMQRQMYPWGSAEPTPERAIYRESRPAPVGCCLSGAAACGALDLAGNVWEWTTSNYKGYPAQSGTLEKGFTPGDQDVPLRGGSYYDSSMNVRCEARLRGHPDGRYYILNLGVRVCAAPLARTKVLIPDS